MVATITVLLVEDDRAQGHALSAVLMANGMRPLLAATGAQALDLIQRVKPDVILVDLGLPDVDGVELCRHLRTQLSSPIIVVTANADEDSMVRALDIGADDYVVKPLSSRVLLARIRVWLRQIVARASIVDGRVLACGDVELDTGSREVRVAGTTLDLLPRQFDLLLALVRNEGKLMTYATLVRACWGLDESDDRLSALRAAMSKLRKALGAGPHRPVILTQHNVGYRLVAP